MSDKKDLPTTPESDAILARAHIRSGDLPRFTVIEPEPETPGSVEEAAEHLAAAVLAEAHNYRIDKAILMVALTRALPDILADRLAAVQGALEGSRRFGRDRDQEAGIWQHRAESAEAARDALRERLTDWAESGLTVVPVTAIRALLAPTTPEATR